MNDLAVYIGILALLSYIVWSKVSKLWGGLAIMLLGVGLMWIETTHSWIGLIILAFGIVMTIDSLLSNNSRRRRR